MGAEYLVIGVAAVGFVTVVLLAWRAARKALGPYAMPTFIFSSIAGGYFMTGSTLQNQVMSFFVYFLGAAFVFGADAHAIRWLREAK